MDKKEEEFLKKLLSTFRVEAREHVSAITSGLIELEKAPDEKQIEIIETVYRETHSLKGAARSVNIKDIESICQSMENIFAALKRKEIKTSPQLFDALYNAIDCISKLISAEKINVLEKSQINEHIHRLEEALKAAIHPQPVSQPSEANEKPETAENKQFFLTPSNTETIRISTVKLDSLLLQVEELLSVKLTASQRADELRDISTSFAVWKKEWAKVQPEVRRVQHARLLEFLEKNHAIIKSLESKLTALSESTEYDSRMLGGMVDDLLDDMKKVLMLPFSSLLEMFPKLVRDLSHDQGKEVELVIQGEQIEIDRRILEEMRDPLIHLIRNCIDHGIEKPDERQGKKKPPRGTLRLAINAKDGNKIEIIVSDDGTGINASSVKSAAVKREIISGEEAGKLNDYDTLSLIFLSGVSTSSIITDVSGRGLGLAIVREKVEKLNGIISIETQPDIGTTFRIVIPLTLATFRGLLVQVNERLFVIPTSNIEKVARTSKEEIKTVENREIISLDGRAVSLVRLADALEITGKVSEGISGESVQVVILGSAEKRMAFMVDDILNEQEVLVKGLGKQLSRVRNIAGATVLGENKVVPILNIHDLIKSGVKAAASARVHTEALKTKAKRKSLLVVEDSITARTLLKNVLELAGYDIKTAVDGLEAITALKTQEFDLVVSDVDMPRLNGFDLTSKIRSDRKLSELPVVLVTGLESREDKERGIEVGANAYIVKSSFDQSNLLEVIQRLI